MDRSALAVMPNGDLVMGGDFTFAGLANGTNRIARWNGTSWAAMTGIECLGVVVRCDAQW